MDLSAVPAGPAIQSSALPLVRVQIDAVVADLGRLETIVDDAAAQLLTSFGDLQTSITAMDPNWMASPAFGAIGKAITAMQFHDLAIQLVGGAKARLKVAADGIDPSGPLKTSAILPIAASDALESDFPKQPVQQANVDSGSIDLF